MRVLIFWFDLRFYGFKHRSPKDFFSTIKDKITCSLVVVFLSAIFLVGCSSPLGFEDTSPDFVTKLDSRVAEGKSAEEKKIRPPKGKSIIKKRKPHKRTVQDMVIPEPAPPPTKKPAWVADLEKKVKVKKIGKGGSTPPKGQTISRDLIGEEPPAPVEKPSAESFSRRPERRGPAKVDIVFVVDSSHSMDYFLRKVKTTFAGFISALEPLDWQIMFTNADHGDSFFLFDWGARKGKAMNLEKDGSILLGKTVLTKKVKNYQSIFIDTLRLHDINEYYEYDSKGDDTFTINGCDLSPGCQTGWNEQPLKSLRSAFVKNRSFFRPSADVATIIFSDSDEGEHSESKKRVTAQNVVDAFQKQWGVDKKRFISYGIIMVPGEDSVCMKKHAKYWWRGEGLFGIELARLAHLTGGKNYSLCSGNYTALAHNITLDFNK